jgi:hypothetical protein
MMRSRTALFGVRRQPKDRKKICISILKGTVLSKHVTHRVESYRLQIKCLSHSTQM